MIFCFLHNEEMFYKKKEKSFFETKVEDTKEEIEKIEEKGAKKVLKWYDFGSSKLRDEIKRRPAQYFFLFITTFLGSVITSSIALVGFSGNLLTFIVPHPAQKVAAVQSPSTQATVESQKYDPLLLASKMKKKEIDFELVDIRPVGEYMGGHIAGAINIPVYGTNLVTKNGDLDSALLNHSFQPYLATDKLLIIYAQNAYSTIPNDIASLLSSSKKRVKALAVGWEEWLHLNK